MKLNIKPDCGNAPKKELVKYLTCYFASNEIEKGMGFLDTDIRWELVGSKTIRGKDQFRLELHKRRQNSVVELTIHSILSHGKEAAINGEMLFEDGSVIGFSDFYEFSSAKGNRVKTIVSYMCEVK